MASEWFVVRDGKELGPYSPAQLKEQASQGVLAPDDLVRRADMKSPTKASSIKGLFSAVPAAPRLAVARPVNRADKERFEKREPREPRRSSSGRWQSLGLPAKLGLVGGGVSLAVLFACCGGFALIGAVGGKKSCETAVGGLNDGKVNGGEPAEKVIEVSAPELLRAYKANEVAADEKYKGKLLEVRGVVHSIEKDITDTIYVTMESGGQFEFTKVQCFFGDKYKAEAARVSKGTVVKIRGQCRGKSFNVVLQNCEFVR